VPKPSAPEKTSLLVSTLTLDTFEEQAVFGGGFRNGLIGIACRLLAQGRLSRREPKNLDSDANGQ